MFYKLKYLIKKNRKRAIDEYDIDKKQLEKMVDNGAILLDVRSPQEYKEGHLKNAILLPEYEIIEKAKEILPDKNKTIIVYCSSGYRSKRAKKELKKLGYTNIYNLYNGSENY